MKGRDTFDVIVVGNGILGLSLALTLIRKKLKVALVGETDRPWSASTAAGAMLGCYGEVTSSLLGNEYGRMKHEFAVRALKLWDDWLDKLEYTQDHTDIITANGTIVILNTIGYSKVDDVNFKAIRDSLKNHDEKFEDIDPIDIEWLDPYALSRPGKAIYIPNEHAVNPTVILQRLEKSFLLLGGALINEFGVKIESNAGQADALVLNSGKRLISNKIVLAAGVKSQDLLNTLPEIAVSIPKLVSGRGVSALVSTADGSIPENVIRTPNRAFACGLHIVPRGKGEVYIGATNAIAPRVAQNPKTGNVVSLLESSYRQIRRDLQNGHLHRILTGNRPVSLDGYPLIGETGLKGLWMMTGTYRDGLTLSPYLAQEMAKLICGESTDPDIKIFSPVRTPIQPYTRQEIIKETVEHTLATGYETDWRIPGGWHEVIESDMYSLYEKFTNELHPSFTPPPDILIAATKHMSIRKILYKYYANITK